MSQMEFVVRNVKCDGCAANIKNNLGKLTGVDEVEVDISTGHVTVKGMELTRSELAQKLKEIGYPIKS